MNREERYTFVERLSHWQEPLRRNPAAHPIAPQDYCIRAAPDRIIICGFEERGAASRLYICGRRLSRPRRSTPPAIASTAHA